MRIKKDKASKFISQFEEAYKNEDFDAVVKLYPTIIYSKGDFLKSDRMEISNITIKTDDNIIIDLVNHWTNPYGKDFTNKIRFYLKEFNNSYIIADSKNFIQYKDNPLYIFSKKVGAISLSDSTDLSISKKIDDATELYNICVKKVTEQLSTAFSVTKCNWEKDEWNNSASGSVIVTNISKFNIPNVKYHLSYTAKKKSQTPVVTDEGYVCYDTFRAGTSRSFSFYTSYIANAAWLHVNVKCENIEELAKSIIYQYTFKGNELENYKKFGYLNF